MECRHSQLTLISQLIPFLEDHLVPVHTAPHTPPDIQLPSIPTLLLQTAPPLTQPSPHHQPNTVLIPASYDQPNTVLMPAPCHQPNTALMPAPTTLSLVLQNIILVSQGMVTYHKMIYHLLGLWRITSRPRFRCKPRNHFPVASSVRHSMTLQGITIPP